MRKIVSFALAGVLLLAAVGTWAMARTRGDSQAKASEHIVAPSSLGDRISPFELMRRSKEMPAQTFDAF
jgi:hypothetical protein